MIEVLHTDTGDIKAVCEWWMVNEKGEFDPYGYVVWVAELEVSKSFRHNGCISEIIKRITDKVPYARQGYFWRKGKYPDRPQHTYNRRQWLNRVKGGM